MPLVPNWIEELLFLTLNRGHGAALDMWGGKSEPTLLQHTVRRSS